MNSHWNTRLGAFCATLLAFSGLSYAQATAPIHFSPQPIPFVLDSAESPERRSPETMAGGVALFDYDNDGLLDIYFANGAEMPSLKKTSPKYMNRLFHNNGNGTFTDVTEKAGVAGSGYDMAVAIGDYDNDGHEDLFVAGLYRNTLYHNNGDGTFTDVTAKAGLAQPDKEYGPLWGMGAAWVDINNDGLLDLFVLNYLKWDPNNEPSCPYQGKPEYCSPKLYKETPNQLFRNSGGGVFTDISASSGIRAYPGKGMGVVVADYDGDGFPDFFVSNDKMPNSLFRNKGNLKFEELALDAGVALPEQGNTISGMGVDFKDFNNDGLPDLVVVALNQETFPVYINDGKGGFIDRTSRSRMGPLSYSMGGYSPNVADFDNDGWKDIFVSRGHVESPNFAEHARIDQPNTVFRNTADDKWVALTEEAGFAALPPRRHRGAAVGDLNNDGKLDVVVTAISAPAEIWINDSPNKSHWLKVALEGTKSNRDGIGARIKVVAGGKVQYDHVSYAHGYASSSAGPVHFGLGTASAVDEVEIRWPSGIVQTLKGVAVDRVLRIKEAR